MRAKTTRKMKMNPLLGQIFEDKDKKEDEIETSFWGRFLRTKTTRKMKSKPPSGPSVHLSGVTKELGATVVSRRSSWTCLLWFEIEKPFWSRR